MNIQIQSIRQKTLFKRIKDLKNNQTASEKIFELKLKSISVNYIFQKGFIKGDYYCIVDFYLPKPFKICIEIDGGYHLSEIQKKRDLEKDKYLKCRGFKVIRLTNEEAEIITTYELNRLILFCK